MAGSSRARHREEANPAGFVRRSDRVAGRVAAFEAAETRWDTGFDPTGTALDRYARRPVNAPWLLDYYFRHDDLLVLPIEHLSERGMSAALREEILRRERLQASWCDLFDASFALAWERLEALHRRAPEEWFPPRLQHVCIVPAGSSVRPYFQPFHQCAWLLHESDFDPARSSVELAVYQLLLVARMGILQQVAPGLRAQP